MFGIKFTWPSVEALIFLFIATLIVSGMIYGVRNSIEDGSLTNKPELLRQIVFWSFSPVLAIRFAHAFGLNENSFRSKVLMIAMFYVPVGLVLAEIGGLR